MPRFTSTIVKCLLVLLALLPGFALAHEGHSSTGFAFGLAHPLGGLDHLLAMVAVGFWAAHLGGQARWQLPLVFVVAMVLGGTLGITGLAAPLLLVATEPMVLASSVVIGVLLASSGRISLAVAAPSCASFAVFHGLAHGSEMPMGSSAIGYALGFAMATVALHGVGLVAGLGVRFIPGIHRLAGGFITLCGLALVAT
ncbi:HupE/UreJ family protein [Saccharospirillum impatiens]|uniref:HupE/UreJ family protein n=1 Tax=Saccharospirillum impatiens TaxID=169438 RepID=UPI000421FBCF|nr:HupE/UreJ family protein [Saccharospirillum impatiens]